LDLGTGTGTLARWWARQGYHVHGLDPDPRLLAAAAELDASEELSISYTEGVAEELPFPDNVFDLVSAGQCWHWFDPPRATAEIRRVLRPDGVVIIAHYDWLPNPGSLAAATEALILKHNPSWALGGGDGLHPQAAQDLAAAGFQMVDHLVEEVPQPFTPEAWRGRIRASVGIAASLDEAGVHAFDGELASLLARDFPGDSLAIPHLLDITVARREPASSQ